MVEAGGRRRRGQRVLYYFRTPPSVRVGREALDPEAMRLLEQHNPDVTFDWERLLKSGSSGSSGSTGSPGSGSSGSGSSGSRDERRRDRRDQRRGRPDTRPPVPSSSFAEPPNPPAPVPEQDDEAEQDEVMNLQNPENPEPGEPGEPEEPGEPVQEPVEVPERYVRLGAEGLTRLRARYADIIVRLAARPMEEAERTELMVRAEQLNPDAWQTPGEVAAALEAYEAVFESLRSVIGRQPRRRRL